MRKVGNFISKKKGNTEPMYLDIDTVKELSKTLKNVIPPKKINSIGLEIYNIDELKSVILFGTLEHNNKIYKSKEISIDEYKFAEQLFNLMENDHDDSKSLPDLPFIKDSLEEIKFDLYIQLINDGL